MPSWLLPFLIGTIVGGVSVVGVLAFLGRSYDEEEKSGSDSVTIPEDEHDQPIGRTVRRGLERTAVLHAPAPHLTLVRTNRDRH